MRCSWTGLSKGDQCTECGYALPRDYDKPPIRECLAPWKPEKLGDWTERQLKKLGVTEERYQAAKEMFGLSPECNCSGRIAWLNAVSDWWRGESITDQQKDHNEG